jgi:2-dehydro-3-deoxygluconokinase
MHMKSTLDVLTYGEAMALFAATETGPLEKVERFSKRIAGAELNVATGLARLGFKDNLCWILLSAKALMQLM